jgi:hypothetical protein
MAAPTRHVLLRRALVLMALAATMTLLACSASTKDTPVADTAGSSSFAPSQSASSTATAPVVDPNAPDVNAAGDIPDTQVFVPITHDQGPFTIKVPEGWGRNDTSDVTTFSDNFNSVQLRVTSSPAPTESSAQRDEVPAIQSVTPGFALDAISTVQRKAGAAVLITYRADSAPNPVTGKVIKLAVERYEFWQSGKEAIIVLSGPVGADNVDPWKIITDSFAWA